MNRLLTSWRDKPNNRKLLSVVQGEVDQLETTLETVDDWRALENAKGKVLDAIGRDVGQARGDNNDETYRVLIRSKLLSTSSKGDLNSIMTIIATVLQVDLDSFEILELYDTGESAMLEVSKLPLAALNKAGISSDEFISLVKQSVAGGVGIKSIRLEGTFEFSESLIKDSDKGFDRGTLGALFEEG